MGATRKGTKAKAKASRRAQTLKATHDSERAKSKKCEVPKDLADKKKHVRELAKIGDWQQIKSIYGEKMMKKAMAYVERNRSSITATYLPAVDPPPPSPPSVLPRPPASEKVTFQLLTKQILAINGYDTTEKPRPPTPNRPTLVPDTVQRKPAKQKTARAKPQVVQSVPSAADTTERTCRQTSARQIHQSPTRMERNPSVGTKTAPITILDSPETLTEEQKRRIEERRREALQKRKRALVPTTRAVPTRDCHRIPRAQKDDHKRQQHHQDQSARVQAWETYPTKRYAGPSATCPPPPRKMPQDLVRSLEPAAIDNSMLHEMEIAAQITDWDFDEPVDRRVVTPPSHGVHQSGYQREGYRNGAPPPRPDRLSHQASVSLSNPPARHASHNRQSQPHNNSQMRSGVAPPQEKQQNRAAFAISLSQELAAAADVARWELEQEQAASERVEAVDRCSGPQSQVAINTNAKQRPVDTSVKPPRQATTRARDPITQTSTSAAHMTQDETTELESFMAKHLLEDKFDAAVLDFVNLMLA